MVGPLSIEIIDMKIVKIVLGLLLLPLLVVEMLIKFVALLLVLTLIAIAFCFGFRPKIHVNFKSNVFNKLK